MKNKMMWCRVLVVAACLLTGARVPMAQAPAAGATLYEGARLIVGDGSAPIESSAFVVEAGRFTRVGRKGEIQAPPGAARVDLTGKTIIPAFIDTHGLFAKRYDATPGSSYLFRPDQHLNARWRTLDVNTVRSALSRASCLHASTLAAS